MSRKQGPRRSWTGMRPAAIAAGRRQEIAKRIGLAEEAAA